MRSTFGRRFGLREAATYLDMRVHTLRRLVREQRIEHHREPGTRAQFVFYERGLLAYLEATRVAPQRTAASAALPMDPALRDLMPETRRFA